MDIWEANRLSTAFTPHPCSTPRQYRCSGVECGDNSANQRYQGICDKDGCDFNSYRMGDKFFFGPGPCYKVDTMNPITVVTQFLTTDGTDNGALSEIRRFYVQNGQVITNSNTNIKGLPVYNSLTDKNCAAQKQLFNETNDYAKKGGLKGMDAAFSKGMVLVMSLWDDHDVNMLWLDSDFPLTKDRNSPGVQRGPCSTSSGKPTDVESKNPNSSVMYSNIKVGPIGSTFKSG